MKRNAIKKIEFKMRGINYTKQCLLPNLEKGHKYPGLQPWKVQIVGDE